MFSLVCMYVLSTVNMGYRHMFMSCTIKFSVEVCLTVVFVAGNQNRKRQRSGGDEENGHLVPQAKRQSGGHPLSPEPGRDAFDSEVQGFCFFVFFKKGFHGVIVIHSLL